MNRAQNAFIGQLAELPETRQYALALQVLALLDGLPVSQVHDVLREAASIMNAFTRHDYMSTEMQLFAAEVRELEDERLSLLGDPA